MRHIKAWVKENFPWAARLKSTVFASPRQVFSEIYSERSWGGRESASGPGSDIAATGAIREKLPDLLQELNAHSLLDAPCGDFKWMKEVDLQVERYIGVDVVPDLIQEDQRFATGNRTFLVRDITKDALPRADVVLCRDCLVHLPLRHIWKSLRNFKSSGAKFLITTTFPGPETTVVTPRGRSVQKNCDIVMGEWRPLDLEQPPFHFPKPSELISENTPSTKSLGVWELQKLNTLGRV